MVVDDDRKHVRRRPVGAEQHEVVEILVLPRHAALDLVSTTVSPVSGAFSRITGLTPGAHRTDRGRASDRCRASAAGLARVFAHLRELFGRRVAAVGAAARKQCPPPPRGAAPRGELVDGVAVPIDAEPTQPVDDGVDRALVERSRSVSSIRSSILPPRRARTAN
jgi:hypothetical protein